MGLVTQRPHLRLLAGAAAVFLVALLVLAWNVRVNTIGAAYADPLALVRAQDESTYVNSAIRMTQDGDWLTPKLMGRPFLFKPPLIQWLSALSIQLAGLGLLSVRLPSLFFGAAAVATVFAWTARTRTSPIAVFAALLLLSDPIWGIFSRLVFTDVLASTLALLAMCTVAFDGTLGRRRSRMLFGVFAGAAVLAKSVVGVLPFAALTLYSLIMPRDERPRALHIVECLVTCLLVALPWHLYQLWTHRDWFWTEFVEFQLVTIGLNEDTGIKDYPYFYIRRLRDMDPVLLVASLMAAFGVVRGLRRRDPVEISALCWFVMVAVALAVFRGRSLSYMVLLLPGLCVLSGLFVPRWLEHRWIPLLAFALAAFAVKSVVTQQFWSLRYQFPPVESAAGLRDYYLQNRKTDLVIASPDDFFYAIALPGLRVRYGYVDPKGMVANSLPHYVKLGIAVTPTQLVDSAGWTPIFRQRLGEWGVRSGEPIASAILLSTPADMLTVVNALPQSDFSVPASWEPMLADAVRESHVLHRSGQRLYALRRDLDIDHRRSLPLGW